MLSDNISKNGTSGQYPERYEQKVTLKDGWTVFLRPVKTTDGPRIQAFFRKMSPQTIYFRFLTHLDHLPPELVYHFVHIDYRSQFALAAIIEEASEEAIIAVCRYSAEMRDRSAELAIVVRDDWQGRGLGKIMVSRVIDAARENGITRMIIHLDSRNDVMKNLFMGLGHPCRHESSLIDIFDRMEIDM